MALLDRVKERLNPQLSDSEVQALIAEASDEILRRYGPAVGEEAITATFSGGNTSLFLERPLDPEKTVEVVEIDGDVETTLDAGDYRVWNGGRLLERLSTGANARSRWANLVTLSYFPIDDTSKRDEVTIKLVKLSIDYEGGVSREDIDGYSTTFSDYTKERESLLASLAPSSVRMA